MVATYCSVIVVPAAAAAVCALRELIIQNLFLLARIYRERAKLQIVATLGERNDDRLGISR